MPHAQAIAVALRKQQLLDRIEAQRDQLTACVEPFRKPLALADSVVQAGRIVREQPWIAGVAAFVVVVLGRRYVWRWIGRGWTLWRGWRTVRRWLNAQGYL